MAVGLACTFKRGRPPTLTDCDGMLARWNNDGGAIANRVVELRGCRFGQAAEGLDETVRTRSLQRKNAVLDLLRGQVRHTAHQAPDGALSIEAAASPRLVLGVEGINSEVTNEIVNRPESRVIDRSRDPGRVCAQPYVRVTLRLIRLFDESDRVKAHKNHGGLWRRRQRTSSALASPLAASSRRSQAFSSEDLARTLTRCGAGCVCNCARGCL
jgi:hypothetical protein